MKKLIFSTLLLSLFSCSSYVKFKYRVPSEFYLPEGTALLIVKPEKGSSSPKSEVLTQIENSLRKDKWWKIVEEKPTDGEFFELKLLEYSENSNLKSSYSKVEDDGTNSRHATYEAFGLAKVSIVDSGGKEVFIFEQPTVKLSSSKATMPKPRSSSSLRPIFEALLGVDREQNAIHYQNQGLRGDSIELLKKAVGEAVTKKITPNLKVASVKFLDGEDDMKAAKKFMNLGEYRNALKYLEQRREENSRADILYNLGIVHEALQEYGKGCSFYRQAYQLDQEADFLEQQIACENRSNFFEVIRAATSLSKN